MATMRTIVVTGASDGIGKAAVEELRHALPTARLVVIGRNPEKTRAVAEANHADSYTCDFSELDQVRRLAEELNRDLDSIDVLANNAGGIFDGPVFTGDGFERTWQINVVAPYLLTHLLMDTLRASQATVVATSSIAALLMAKFRPEDPQTKNPFDTSHAYGNAKLGDAMVTRVLADHIPEISPVAFHPGVIASNFASGTKWSMAPVYDVARKYGIAGPQGGGHRLAFFAQGTPGIHFERGEFYLRPGVKCPYTPGMKFAEGVIGELNQALDLHWPQG